MLKHLISPKSSRKASQSTKILSARPTAFMAEVRRALAINACAPLKGVRRPLT